MPEGPEVRRAADALHEALAGRALTAVEARTRAAKAWLKEHSGAFEGRTVERVRSHGKHLVGRVEGGLFFHSHFMMWGRWHVVGPDDPAVAERDRRERARLLTAEAAALLYSAPVFDVGQGDPYEALEPLATLGPDILPYEGAFDAGAFHHRLLANGPRDEAIGSALLDQRVCAGIGNYLRADILFEVRINPWMPAGELSDDERARLTEAIPRLARRAYETGGRTVPADVQARMQADDDLVYQPGRPYQTRHYVFRRTNLPCLRCGHPVRQQRQVTGIVDGEEKTRIMYFCPICQRVPDDVLNERNRRRTQRARVERSHVER